MEPSKSTVARFARYDDVKIKMKKFNAVIIVIKAKLSVKSSFSPKEYEYVDRMCDMVMVRERGFERARIF